MKKTQYCLSEDHPEEKRQAEYSLYIWEQKEWLHYCSKCFAKHTLDTAIDLSKALHKSRRN